VSRQETKIVDGLASIGSATGQRRLYSVYSLWFVWQVLLQARVSFWHNPELTSLRQTVVLSQFTTFRSLGIHRLNILLFFSMIPEKFLWEEQLT
jgi:hypothetical protein